MIKTAIVFRAIKENFQIGLWLFTQVHQTIDERWPNSFLVKVAVVFTVINKNLFNQSESVYVGHQIAYKRRSGRVSISQENGGI